MNDVTDLLSNIKKLDTEKKKNILYSKDYRFDLNPEEERIVKQFIERIGDGDKIYLLQKFVGNVCFGDPNGAKDRDLIVFLNAIQWLGSHVGQCFLRDLGYTFGKKEINP